MNGIINAIQAGKNYIGQLMSSMFNVKGLFSIAMVTLLVATASQASGDIGDILKLVSATVLAGFGFGIMRQQATSDKTGLPEISFRNFLAFLKDGLFANALKTAVTIGLAITGGMLAGDIGVLIGFIYSQLTFAHSATALEMLPKSNNVGDKIDRGTKALKSVFDLPTILGTIFAKPLNTLAAIAVTVGADKAVDAAGGAAPILAALATVMALVTTAHVWSKVYRSANCASDCEHAS